MAKAPARADPAYLENLASYERLVASVPGLERKGAANPYTALNGNMSSYLHPRGALALRLAPMARAEFLERYQTTLFESYGVVQKEYVTVPADLLADTKALEPYFHASYDYVAALEPKPTAKARKT